MTSLGVLEIGLGLNTARYDEGIAKARRDLTSLERRATRLGTTVLHLKVTVDDKSLYALNRHLDIKKAHIKEVSKEVLKVNVDDSQLKKITGNSSKDIKALISHNVSVSVKDANSGLISKIGDIVKEVKEVVKAINRTRKGGIGSLVSSLLGGVGSSLMQGVSFNITKNFSQGILDQLESEVSNIFGSTSAVGQSIVENIGKRIRNYIENIDEAIENELSKPKKKRDTERLRSLRKTKNFINVANLISRSVVDPDLLEEEKLKNIYERSEKSRETRKKVNEGAARENQRRARVYAVALEVSNINLANLQKERAILLASRKQTIKIAELDQRIGELQIRRKASNAQDQLEIDRELFVLRDKRAKEERRVLSLASYGNTFFGQKNELISNVASSFRLSRRDTEEAVKIGNLHTRYSTGKDRVSQINKRIASEKARGEQLLASRDLIGESIGTDSDEYRQAESEASQSLEKIKSLIASKDKIKSKTDKAFNTLQSFVNEGNKLFKKIKSFYGEYTIEQLDIIEQLIGRENMADIENLPPVISSNDMPDFAGGVYKTSENIIALRPEMYERFKEGKSTENDRLIFAHELAHGYDAGFGEFYKRAQFEMGRSTVGYIPTEQEVEDLNRPLFGSDRNKTFLEMYPDPHDHRRETFAEITGRNITRKAVDDEYLRMGMLPIPLEKAGNPEQRMKEVIDLLKSVRESATRLQDTEIEDALNLVKKEAFEMLDVLGVFRKNVSFETRRSATKTLPLAFAKELDRLNKMTKVILSDVIELFKEVNARVEKQESQSQNVSDIAVAEFVDTASSGIEKAGEIISNGIQNIAISLANKLDDIATNQINNILLQPRNGVIDLDAPQIGSISELGMGGVLRLAGIGTQQTLAGVNQGFKTLIPAIKTGYGVLQGAENFALNILPFGHAAKGITKNVALPAAAFGLAASTPVGGIVAHGMTSAADAAIAPLVQSLASQLIQAVTAHLASIPIVGGQLSSLAAEAITGASGALGTGIAETGAAIAGGQLLIGTGEQAIKTILSAENQQELAQIPSSTAKTAAQTELALQVAGDNLKLLASASAKLTEEIKSQLTGVSPQLKILGTGVNQNYLNLLPPSRQKAYQEQIEAGKPLELTKADKKTIVQNLRQEDLQREVSYILGSASALEKAAQSAMDRIDSLLAKVPKNERWGHPLASLKSLAGNVKSAAEKVNPIYDLKKMGVNQEILDAIDVKAVVVPDMESAGSDAVSGLVKGLSSKISELEAVSIDIASTPLEITKKINKIQSPSKEFEEIGKNLIEGEIKGIKSKEKELQATMAIIAKNMIENRYLATQSPLDISPFFSHEIEEYQKKNKGVFVGDIETDRGGTVSQVNQAFINKRIAQERENEANRKATQKALEETDKHIAKMQELAEKEAERTRKEKAEKEAWEKANRQRLVKPIPPKPLQGQGSLSDAVRPIPPKPLQVPPVMEPTTTASIVPPKDQKPALYIAPTIPDPWEGSSGVVRPVPPKPLPVTSNYEKIARRQVEIDNQIFSNIKERLEEIQKKANLLKQKQSDEDIKKMMQKSASVAQRRMAEAISKRFSDDIKSIDLPQNTGIISISVKKKIAESEKAFEQILDEMKAGKTEHTADDLAKMMSESADIAEKRFLKEMARRSTEKMEEMFANSNKPSNSQKDVTSIPPDTSADEDDLREQQMRAAWYAQQRSNRNYNEQRNNILNQPASVKRAEDALKKYEKSIEKEILKSIESGNITGGLSEAKRLVSKIQENLSNFGGQTLDELVELEMQLGDSSTALKGKDLDNLISKLKEKEKELDKAIDYVDQQSFALGMSGGGTIPPIGMGPSDDGYGFGEFINNLRQNYPIIDKASSIVASFFAAFTGYGIIEQSAMLIQQFAVTAFQSALEMERLQTTLNFSTGDTEASLSRLKSQADSLGTSFLSSAKNYQQFSSAVMNSPLEFQKDNIFEGINLGLATRGAGSQQQDKALLAITQIASKARVSMEELNQQLSEALPGALQIASRSMGMTSQEFTKLIESGAVLAEDLLPKLAAQIQLESAGGISVINDTAFAQVARFQNQLELLKVALGEPLLDATKLGLPSVTNALKILTENGETVATVLASIGITALGGFVALLKQIGVIDLALRVLNITATTTRGAFVQLGTGLLKGLGWTALIYAGIEAIKELYRVINAGSEESRRSLKSTKESLNELARIQGRMPTTVEQKNPIQRSIDWVTSGNREWQRISTVSKIQEGSGLTNQLLGESTSTFNPERISKFKVEIDGLRQQLKDLKVQEIIASGDADVKKLTAVRQEIANTNQEIQKLIEKNFPEIGLIVAEIAVAEERIKELNRILSDPESGSFERGRASNELKIIESQLRVLKQRQEQYNDAIKENLTNYQRLTEQVNRTARALSNIEFMANTRTVLSEINTKRQVLAGNVKPFEMDLMIREQSLSTLRNQFNSLNGLLTTKEKELQNTLTDEINQRITDLMPELNGLDFRVALQQGKVSGESIDQRVQQLGESIPFELKQVLETAKQQASIRQQTLNIDKSIVDNELEIRNIRRERARNARQAAIVGANVNERIDTLRQLPFGGAVASYRDAISEVRNQERLLQEAYRRLESASDDPNIIRQEVDNTRLALEQARANLLQQQRALEDYYRNLDRQIQDFNRQIQDYQRRIEDAQLSAFRENRTIAESYEDLVKELDRNILNINNELKNIEDKIGLQRLKNTLTIPGAGGIGRELNNIILEYLQSEADSASESHSFESRTQEIEANYIASLRRIRDLHEQQAEAERNRLRTIEDLKRSQEDLVRSLSDLVRNTQRELGNTKGSLMAVNSEILSIAPKIQSSGDILANSIKQVAENIKASVRNNIVNFAKPQNRLVDDGRNIPLPKPLQRPQPPRINNQPRRRGELEALNQPPKNTALNRINQVRRRQNVARTKPRQQPKPKPPVRPQLPATTALNRVSQVRDRQNVQPQVPPLLTSLQWLSKQTNPQTIVNGLKVLEQRFKNDAQSSTILNTVKSLRQKIERNPQVRGAIDGVNQIIRGIEQQRQGIVKSDVFRQLGEQFKRFDNWFKDGIDNLHRFFDPKRPPRRRASIDEGQLYASGVSDMGMYELTRDDLFKLDPNSRFEKIIPQLPTLPPVPSLDFESPKQQVETVKELDKSLLNSQKTLQELNREFAKLNALDGIANIGRQIAEQLLSTKRSVRDAVESVADLTLNAKGYLTVQEEIRQAVIETSRQYRSQLESLQDQRRNLSEQIRQNQLNTQGLVINSLQENLDSDVREAYLRQIKALEQSTSEYQQQLAILDETISQVESNRGLAERATQDRVAIEKANESFEKYNSLLADLADRRELSNPLSTLFSGGGGDSLRVLTEYRKRAFELNEDIKRGLYTPAQAQQMTMALKEMADIDLAQAFIESNPAVSAFGDLLRAAFTGGRDTLQQMLNVLTSFLQKIGEMAANQLLMQIFGGGGAAFSPIPSGGGAGFLGGVLNGLFGGGLGGLGGGLASTPFTTASSFSLGTGFSLFSEGGIVGDGGAPLEKNLISAFRRERSMSGGRTPRLIVANDDELVLTPKETQAYLQDTPIKNYANGGFVGGGSGYNITNSNSKSSNQSLAITNVNNINIESRNDMGYSLNQIKERENAQNERTKRRFFGE